VLVSGGRYGPAQPRVPAPAIFNTMHPDFRMDALQEATPLYGKSDIVNAD